MGKRKYPPLTLGEVIAILTALRFEKKNQTGSHAQYEGLGEHGQRCIVTVDVHYKEFDDDLIKIMIRQSGWGRDAFYGATKRTARRASVPLSKNVQVVESE